MTTKQRRFIEEYLKDFNATQAAIRAGYSEKTAGQIGYENLKKPEISDAIQERIDRMTMAADEVLLRLTEAGRNAQMQFLRPDGTIDLAGLIGAGLAHLVKAVKFDREGRPQVQFLDVQRAHIEVGKIRGLYEGKGREGAQDARKSLAELTQAIREGADTFDLSVYDQERRAA